QPEEHLAENLEIGGRTYQVHRCCRPAWLLRCSEQSLPTRRDAKPSVPTPARESRRHSRRCGSLLQRSGRSPTMIEICSGDPARMSVTGSEAPILADSN